MSSLPSPLTIGVSRRSPSALSRPAALALTSIASVVVYTFGLVLPYSVFALQLKPLANIAKLTRNNPAAQAGFVLTFALLSGLYYLAWRLCRPTSGRSPSRLMWPTLMTALLAINLVVIWLYPIGAADIFDNIVRGRISAKYGGNPFYNVPKEYAQDRFYPYIAWRVTPSAYGPLWELLAAGTSRLAGDDKLANVLGFKLLNLVFYFGCVILIARILNRHAPERALQGVCLFALNPLVIYETAGNGHNDIVMAFFILLGLFALLNRRFTLGALALTAGALIKFIPLLLLPAALALGLRAQPALKHRLAFLLVTALAGLGLVAAAFAPFWRGGDILNIKRRQSMFTSSLPAVIQTQLEGPLGPEQSQQIVSRAALGLTGLVAAAAAWRTWVEEDWLSPLRASTFVLLFYLLFTCLWFQSWYTLWPLALAALLPEGETSRIAVLLSYAALWKAIVFDFFLYRGGPLPPRAWRETLLGPITLGLAWFYGVYALIRKFKIPKSEIINS